MQMSERIKERRLAMGFTQEELANKLGLQKSAIAKYENGRVENIKRSVISKMAEILECKPAYLMGWSETPEKLQAAQSVADSLCHDSYEHLVVNEMKKMNQKGRVKLLDTAREMTCNPLYNPNYQVEVAAAHERTDIEVTEEMRQHDDALMDDDTNWE